MGRPPKISPPRFAGAVMVRPLCHIIAARIAPVPSIGLCRRGNHLQNNNPASAGYRDVSEKVGFYRSLSKFIHAYCLTSSPSAPKQVPSYRGIQRNSTKRCRMLWILCQIRVRVGLISDRRGPVSSRTRKLVWQISFTGRVYSTAGGRSSPKQLARDQWGCCPYRPGMTDVRAHIGSSHSAGGGSD